MKATWLSESGERGDEITADVLADNGVLYRRMSTDVAAYQPPMERIKAEHGYVHQDEVALRPDTPDLDLICAKFTGEHHHDEDEVRFVLEGEGVFDIRSNDDRWMHVEVGVGDLIVVPAGRHHRFFLTGLKTIRCVRLFKDPSGWVAHYRQAS